MKYLVKKFKYLSLCLYENPEDYLLLQLTAWLRPKPFTLENIPVKRLMYQALVPHQGVRWPLVGTHAGFGEKKRNTVHTRRGY